MSVGVCVYVCVFVCVFYLFCFSGGTLTYTLVFSPYGEGNGNPLQYPCPENPMDGGAQ